jgi:PAS domain S-box-containing protein
VEDRLAEIRRLQGCINNLISVLAFPALWSGQEPPQMVRTLLDGLVGMLHLDFAYARLGGSVDGGPIELVRLARQRNPAVQPQEVGRALNRWLANDPPDSPSVVPNPLGEGEVSMASFRLGLQDEIGVLAAGSRRADFPTEIERLLLRVAANQAAIGLQEARRLSEQRRAAEELEQRVVERTGQLEAVNEELRNEIIERQRAERRLAMQYAITRVLAESDSVADAMPHLLQAIGESMAWEWGALWNLDRNARVLRCESIWHAPNMEAAEFDALSRETVGIPGPGLKGRVWQSAEPTWIADVSQAPNLRRAPTAARLGFRGAIAFPILLRGETIGIMEFFGRAVPQPDDEQLVTLSAIGNQIGQFVERKRLEKEQRKLAALVENSTDFIGIASPEGQVLFVNAAGQKMVGLDGDEHVRATRVLDYVAEESRQRVRQHVLPAVMRHGHWEGETLFRHFQTGAAIPMLQHVFCIKEEGRDRPIALATISRDITERKLAEEALREAQAELAHVTRVMTLGELAASIAHEVNQPLTAVINNGNACLRWLGRQTPDLEEVRGAVRDIIANGQRASDAITRIRAALRKAPTQTERLGINHIIEEVIGLTYHEVQRHGIQLHTELASGLPAVLGDRVQLQQVLLNLVMNGIEAMSTVMERPRQLLLRSGSAGSDGVVVAVQDSGIGLDPHALERIFDAFYTTKPTGMGMGLSISRTIIKAHGGRLWAERHPGPGATFQFILPGAAGNQDD